MDQPRDELQALGRIIWNTNAIHPSQPGHLHHSRNPITTSLVPSSSVRPFKLPVSPGEACGYHWLLRRTTLPHHPSLADRSHAQTMTISTAHHFHHFQYPSIMHIWKWETQRWQLWGWKQRNPDLAPYSLIQRQNSLSDFSRLNLSWLTGGPGGSGVELIEGAGVFISTIIQGQYVIVSA